MRPSAPRIAAELARDAAAGRRAPRRSPRRGTCSRGWPTTTSPSSATASTRLVREDGDDVLRRGARHRARAAALRPAARPAAFGRLTAEARAKAREHQLLDHHQGQLPRHRPPLDLPRLHRHQDVRRRAARSPGSGASSACSPPRPTPSRSASAGHRGARSPRSWSASGFTADSHSGKDLLEILETYPRDELFQTDVDQLLRHRHRGAAPAGAAQDPAVPAQGRVRPVHVLPRLPAPRPLHHRRAAARWRTSCVTAFDGASVDYTTRVSESVLARLHFVVRVAAGQPIPDVDEAELQRCWSTRPAPGTRTSARRPQRVRRGGRRAPGRALRQGLPRGLQGGLQPARRLWSTCATSRRSSTSDSIRLNLYQEPGSAADERRFKLYRRGPLSLTAVLPLFTHLGVEVVDERPYEIRRSDGLSVYIYDFGLEARSRDLDRQRATTACASCSRTRSPRCGTGAPRATASTPWSSAPGSPGARSSSCGRWPSTCGRPGPPSARSTSSGALVSNTAARRGARRPVRGAVRPRPVRRRGAGRGGAGGRSERAGRADRRRPGRGGQPRPRPDHPGLAGRHPGHPAHELLPARAAEPVPRRAEAYVSFKLDPQAVPDLPAPRPMYEIWVYSPARRGRAPALRQGRPRRPALERPARGLPHRGARPGQGADGQERRHRPDRRQGRLRRQGAARPDRGP